MIQNLNKIKTLKNKSASYKLQEEEKKDNTYTKIFLRFARRKEIPRGEMFTSQTRGSTVLQHLLVYQPDQGVNSAALVSM